MVKHLERLVMSQQQRALWRIMANDDNIKEIQHVDEKHLDHHHHNNNKTAGLGRVDVGEERDDHHTMYGALLPMEGLVSNRWNVLDLVLLLFFFLFCLWKGRCGERFWWFLFW